MLQLDQAFAALADRTRRSILSRLAEGEASVSELARPFRMSLPAVSKHLRVLERAGLVEQRRQARWRIYRLRAEPLGEAAAWIDSYRCFWEQRFDALARFLNEGEEATATRGVGALDDLEKGQGDGRRR